MSAGRVSIRPDAILIRSKNIGLLYRALRAVVPSIVVVSLAPLGGCAFLSTLGLVPNSGLPATVPDFEEEDFGNPAVIDNPLLPLVSGTKRIYESKSTDATERIVVEVLDQTRVVSGVECRVVRDRVYVDDILVEDTRDWFAQDEDGNIWYMGEEVDNYNYDQDGTLVDVTHEGAWEAGEDVAGIGVLAAPGYQMPNSLKVGDRYHQEWYEGEAEDIAVVEALDVLVTLADGSTYTCVKTRDYSTLDATINGYKFYAPGVGVVLETNADGTERVELISVEN